MWVALTYPERVATAMTNANGLKKEHVRVRRSTRWRLAAWGSFKRSIVRKILIVYGAPKTNALMIVSPKTIVRENLMVPLAMRNLPMAKQNAQVLRHRLLHQRQHFQ